MRRLGLELDVRLAQGYKSPKAPKHCGPKGSYEGTGRFRNADCGVRPAPKGVQRKQGHGRVRPPAASRPPPSATKKYSYVSRDRKNRPLSTEKDPTDFSCTALSTDLLSGPPSGAIMTSTGDSWGDRRLRLQDHRPQQPGRAAHRRDLSGPSDVAVLEVLACGLREPSGRQVRARKPEADIFRRASVQPRRLVLHGAARLVVRQGKGAGALSEEQGLRRLPEPEHACVSVPGRVRGCG